MSRTNSHNRNKRLLASSIATLISIANGAVAADRNWTNDDGDNLWKNPFNWANDTEPTTADRALISAGNPGFFNAIAILNGSLTTASVGTISITTPSGTYSSIRSDFALETASINFGSSAGFDLDMSSGTTFTVGDDPIATGGGTLILSNNGVMAIRVRDGQSLEFQEPRSHPP